VQSEREEKMKTKKAVKTVPAGKKVIGKKVATTKLPAKNKKKAPAKVVPPVAPPPVSGGTPTTGTPPAGTTPPPVPPTPKGFWELVKENWMIIAITITVIALFIIFMNIKKNGSAEASASNIPPPAVELFTNKWLLTATTNRASSSKASDNKTVSAPVTNTDTLSPVPGSFINNGYIGEINIGLTGSTAFRNELIRLKGQSRNASWPYDVEPDKVEELIEGGYLPQGSKLEVKKILPAGKYYKYRQPPAGRKYTINIEATTGLVSSACNIGTLENPNWVDLRSVPQTDDTWVTEYAFKAPGHDIEIKFSIETK